MTIIKTEPEKSIKHKVVYEKLCSDIIKGVYKPGAQLPTENDLARSFSTSRPTIGRAMRELLQKGLIVRRQGQGTFVKQIANPTSHTLGLLVHWQIRPVQTTSSTIFGIMVPELLRYASQSGYSLLLNDIPVDNHTDYLERAQAVCQRLLDARVAGVFFTPLELTATTSFNVKIAQQLAGSGMAVVLLDRDLTDSYHRSRFDIVGINNEQSSLVLTRHLIEQKCAKIDFVSGTVQTTAINDRYRGYRAALEESQLTPEKERRHQFDSRSLSDNPVNENGQKLLNLVRTRKTEAFVCVNDSTAADLELFFLRNGINVPQDVRIVGFDDLPMDESLPVPLTTIRQNPSALAYESIRTMIDRINHPEMPAREILVKTELIIRASSGGAQ